jgi:aspartyl-tRNA(Asn)/glutamyl-tRNA(Gln) amidotransferase subunit A
LLWQLSAGELLAGYRAREFTPVEVVEALAERIAAHESLGAFTTLCVERALEEARGVRSFDAPLAGVPFAAKDLFDTAAVRTTRGSAMFASHVPERDAAAVALVRRAGGILIGKAQTHEFAWGVTSVNEAMGSSRNPWDERRVPGGSSGGSAVALAASLVPLALGTDTGGSIRIPAAFCGVLGLKPSYARVGVEGVWPLAPSLDHAGPLARSPSDLDLLFDVLGGAGVSNSINEGETVVFCPDLHLSPLQADIERVFLNALGALERLGFRVEERRFPSAGRIEETFRVVQAFEAAQVHAGLFPSRAGEYGKDVRRRLEAAAAVTGAEYARAAAEREAIRADFARILSDGGLLLTPVSAGPPVLADDFEAQREFRGYVLPYTTPQNLAGLPSCAVPAGSDDLGLPVGVQLTGAAWRDEQVLGAAAALHEALA